MTTVDELAVGGRGRVVGVAGSDETSVRLLEMGITPGVQVALIGTAPMGDPLELEVRGYRLCVRRLEAKRITVDVVDGRN